MNIQLLVADHQEVMRVGLKSLISRSSIEVIGEASSESQLMRLLQKQRPQVVILDVRFAGEDGFATLSKIKRKWLELPVLMWSTNDNPTYIARAMALGASGYLPRSVGRQELLDAVRTAAAGSDAWSSEQKQQFTGAPDLPQGLDVHLTPREREALRQLGYGLSNKEIALAMHIGYETVKEHMQHILRKLGAADRTQAAVWAVRNRLV